VELALPFCGSRGVDRPGRGDPKALELFLRRRGTAAQSVDRLDQSRAPAFPVRLLGGGVAGRPAIRRERPMRAP